MLLYMVGMTIRVKNVDTMSPDISVTAIGVKNELPDRARGKRPMTVVIVLSIIGRNLLLREDSQASFIEMPFFISPFICSISKMALFTTIPMRLASPRPAVKENGCLKR